MTNVLGIINLFICPTPCKQTRFLDNGPKNLVLTFRYRTPQLSSQCIDVESTSLYSKLPGGCFLSPLETINTYQLLKSEHASTSPASSAVIVVRLWRHSVFIKAVDECNTVGVTIRKAVSSQPVLSPSGHKCQTAVFVLFFSCLGPLIPQARTWRHPDTMRVGRPPTPRCGVACCSSITIIVNYWTA